MNNFLRNPQGTESFLQDEALRHSEITLKLSKLFKSWGYLPAQTPMFDFYDIYREFVKNEDVYRLIDRNGELLLLRNDITLFLAKQLGIYFSADELPARIYYSDTILRHENSIDISKNEFFQSGVELIGVDSKKGDLEILLLLLETIQIFKIKKFLHIGSRKIFDILFLKFDNKIKSLFAKAIIHRDFELFSKTASEASIAVAKAKKIYDFFSFIGNVDEFEKFVATNLIDVKLKDEVDYLIELGKAVSSEDFSSEIRIDLSEIGERNYYTGVVFKVYAEGASSDIASGGRYDNLLKKFGLDASAVGFSLMQRKIENILPLASGKKSETVLSGNDVMKLYAEAKKLRAKGDIVKLC